MALSDYIIVTTTGNYELTPKGQLAVQLAKEQQTAWVTNRDFVFAWFKGMNVNPDASAVLEFSDELQEYSKLTSKKNIWDNSLRIGEYIKWNYYVQESRADAPLPGGTVTNIVDDNFIEDRILKLSNNTPGFIEYFDRNLLFDYGDVFATPIVDQQGNFIGYQPNQIDLQFFDADFYLSGTYQNTEAKEQVLAWFKGVNLQPTQEVLDTYRPYIKAYLLDSRKTIDTNIDVGIFLVK